MVINFMPLKKARHILTEMLSALMQAMMSHIHTHVHREAFIPVKQAEQPHRTPRQMPRDPLCSAVTKLDPTEAGFSSIFCKMRRSGTQHDMQTRQHAFFAGYSQQLPQPGIATFTDSTFNCIATAGDISAAAAPV